MKNQFASRLRVMLGAVSAALAVASASDAQTSHLHHHAKPLIHHGRIGHHHIVVHHHVIAHHRAQPGHARRRVVSHHPVPVPLVHHRHSVIVHRVPAYRGPVVRQMAPARRHAALCQQVMIHQHWVQHCR